MSINKSMLLTVVVGGVVAVIGAGYLMTTFKDNSFIAKARGGFDTGLL